MKIWRKPNKRVIVIYSLLDYPTMGDKVILDATTFKALASRTRLNILKNLDERQKTISELAKKLDLNKATIYEHLYLLQEVGLVEKKNSENKWVYYKLTWKGIDLLHPEKKKIVVLLSISITCLVGCMLSYIAIIKKYVIHHFNIEKIVAEKHSTESLPSINIELTHLLQGTAFLLLFILFLCSLYRHGKSQGNC